MGQHLVSARDFHLSIHPSLNPILQHPQYVLLSKLEAKFHQYNTAFLDFKTEMDKTMTVTH
jgi:hypothetical protein